MVRSVSLVVVGLAWMVATCVPSHLTNASQVGVAFNGGGFRAHAGHSGLVAGLVERSNGGTFEEVFKKVDHIGTSSGGSWFASQLFYSNNFNEALLNGSATAYNDVFIRNILSSPQPPNASIWNVPIKILEIVDNVRGRDPKKYLKFVETVLATGVSSWNEFIDLILKSPGDLDTKLPLNQAKPVKWAQNKDWVISAAVITTPTDLTSCDSKYVAYTSNSADLVDSSQYMATNFNVKMGTKHASFPMNEVVQLSNSYTFGRKTVPSPPYRESAFLASDPAAVTILDSVSSSSGYLGWLGQETKHYMHKIPFVAGVVGEALVRTTPHVALHSKSAFSFRAAQDSLANHREASKAFTQKSADTNVVGDGENMDSSRLLSASTDTYIVSLSDVQTTPSVELHTKSVFSLQMEQDSLANPGKNCTAFTQKLADANVASMIDGFNVDDTGISRLLSANKDTYILSVSAHRKATFGIDGLFQGYKGSAMPVFQENVEWVQDQIKKGFKELTLSAGSKFLDRILVGDLSVTTADERQFGVKAGRKVTLKVLIVGTTLNLGVLEDMLHYGVFMNEVKNTIALPDNDGHLNSLLTTLSLV